MMDSQERRFVKNEIVPFEVKAGHSRAKSINMALRSEEFNVHYGVKLTDNNIGYTDGLFTFTYFLTFLLKRFFDSDSIIKLKSSSL
jgi:hypothetical protein